MSGGIGVPALLGAWFAIGALCGAYIHWRHGRASGIGAAVALWLLGPGGLLVVALIVVLQATAPHDRQRDRLLRAHDLERDLAVPIEDLIAQAERQAEADLRPNPQPRRPDPGRRSRP